MRTHNWDAKESPAAVEPDAISRAIELLGTVAADHKSETANLQERLGAIIDLLGRITRADGWIQQLRTDAAEGKATERQLQMAYIKWHAITSEIPEHTAVEP